MGFVLCAHGRPTADLLLSLHLARSGRICVVNMLAASTSCSRRPTKRSSELLGWPVQGGLGDASYIAVLQCSTASAGQASVASLHSSDFGGCNGAAYAGERVLPLTSKCQHPCIERTTERVHPCTDFPDSPRGTVTSVNAIWLVMLQGWPTTVVACQA